MSAARLGRRSTGIRIAKGRLSSLGGWLTRLRRRPPQPTEGLVLSGGRSGAYFQLGALRYLYDTVGITPSVITGTSAGSILAALLAQAHDHDGQRRILADIERLSQGVRQNSDMLTELAWYAELQKLMPAWQKAHNAHPRQHDSRTITLPSLGLRSRHRNGQEEEAAGRPTIKLPRWDRSPVLDTLSMIWTMRRSGTDIDMLRGAGRERSMFRPGPIFDALLNPGVFDPTRLAQSPTQLRIAVVGLESGELHYVTGTGGLVDRENRPIRTDAPLSVVDAVHASCAIPGVLPPVRLGDEHYVDGGTRENAPVQIAMTHLGVDRCYAVISLPRGLARESSFADKDMLSIVLRSTAGIMADEILLNDMARARAAGAVVIAPEVNLLGVFGADSGLLSISRDYGYVRAAEACEGATPEQQRLTRDVIEMRHRIWSVENSLFGPDSTAADGVHVGEQSGLAVLKRRLRDLVAQVPAGRLPAGALEWWRAWEGHPYEITEPAYWAEHHRRSVPPS
jgi:predicted acylesterase/phospholipase RssA